MQIKRKGNDSGERNWEPAELLGCKLCVFFLPAMTFAEWGISWDAEKGPVTHSGPQKSKSENTLWEELVNSTAGTATEASFTSSLK